ncbi:DNA-binding protein [Clostridium botulinum]
MKSKSWLIWIIGGICFMLAGILRIIKNRYLNGIIFIVLGFLYVALSIINYKFANKPNRNTLSDEELKNMDNELRELVSEGERIKAIKKYRMATDAGLVEAKEYVDSLSKGETK